jgi:hypothetical protein
MKQRIRKRRVEGAAAALALRSLQSPVRNVRRHRLQPTAATSGGRRRSRRRRGLAALALAGVVGGLSMAATAPAQAIYAKLTNTLDAPAAIGGAVPTGVANIDHCVALLPNGNPSGYQLTVDVDNVNLPDGTALTVTYGGTEGHPENAATVGTFNVTGGAGHFEKFVASLAGANDNLYVLHRRTIILTATDRWTTAALTCAPPAPKAHIGDLDGTITGGVVTVTITVHKSDEQPAAGLLVTGDFFAGVNDFSNDAHFSSGNCTTNGSGTCTLTAGHPVPDGVSVVTFKVARTYYGGATYDPAANHDPDGDSDGTTITMFT